MEVKATLPVMTSPGSVKNGRLWRILNIGIDSDLLLDHPDNEARIRQSIYANQIPAEMIYLVKAPRNSPPHPVHLADGRIKIIPCRVSHWAYFPVIAARAGRRIMKKSKVDIIQVQEPFLSGPVGAYLSRRFHVPLAVGMFNDDIDNPHWLAESLLNRIANPIGKWVLRRAAAIRTDSRQMADRLENMGYANVSYIPFLLTNVEQFSSPSPEAAEWRSRLLGKKKGPLVLVVARLEWQKNIPMLLEAFASVQRKVADAVLVVAGDGALREELEAKAAVLAPGSILFLGKVPYNHLPPLFQAADLSVLPSHHETSARVLSLSLLAGTPVLSTDTTGAREVIEDGLTGRIVPVEDLEAFTMTLLEMCMDDEGRKAMGLRGKGGVTKKVSVGSVVPALREMYQKILNGRR